MTNTLLKRLSLLPLVGFILLHNLALCNLHLDAILLISVLCKTLSVHTSYITKATKEISWILMCLFGFLVHKSCQTIISLIKLPLDIAYLPTWINQSGSHKCCACSRCRGFIKLSLSLENYPWKYPHTTSTEAFSNVGVKAPKCLKILAQQDWEQDRILVLRWMRD